VPIISFVGSKGGSLKTACALSVSAEAARRGLRVTLVDCDPQSSATRSLPRRVNLADNLDNSLAPQETVLDPLSAEGVSVEFEEITAGGGSLRLFRGGEMLAQAAREQVVRHVQRAASGADLVIVDTAPYLTGTFAPMLAADLVIIPTEPTGDALRSVPQYVQAVRAVAPNTPYRILLTKTVDVERTTKDAPALIDAQFPGVRLQASIPSSARGKESNAHLVPTVFYAIDKRDRAVRTAYIALTTELLRLTGLALGTAQLLPVHADDIATPQHEATMETALDTPPPAAPASSQADLGEMAP